jgi:hypothetical protein
MPPTSLDVSPAAPATPPRPSRRHPLHKLIDRILATTLQAGRALGWQRIVPIVLLGFMATQWTREHREGRPDGKSNDQRPDG